VSMRDLVIILLIIRYACDQMTWQNSVNLKDTLAVAVFLNNVGTVAKKSRSDLITRLYP
jgi:hypothetical protein